MLTPGIIWTILFHRLFGPIVPATNEFLDVPYPLVSGMPQIDVAIDSKIDQFIKTTFSPALTAELPAVGQILINFSQKVPPKSKKRSGWFGYARDDSPNASYCWESWVINVNCLPFNYRDTPPMQSSLGTMNNAERLLRLSALSFEDTVNEILSLADTHKDHIPAILTIDVAPFPYEIVVDQTRTSKRPPAADDETWTQYIKKLMD